VKKIIFLSTIVFLSLFLVSCETTQSGSSGTVRNRAHRSSSEFRGAWVYDPRRFEPDEVVRDLKNAGFNAVFVRLSSAGAAYYPSKILPKAPGVHMDYARAYSDAGKKYGVAIHAWHVCFMMHYASKGEVASAIKKGEVMRDAKGRATRPTYNVPVRTPALASNRALERNAVLELVTQYPLDGVQLDYIRYFAPGVDYSVTSRTAFEKSRGAKVKKWPTDVSTGLLRGQYQQWKADLITSVVKDVGTAVKQANPQAKLSAAVWHSPEVGKNDYCQDWVKWVREGYLDFIVPMNYTTNEGILEAWISTQQGLVKEKIPLYAGLGSYMLKGSDQLNRQVDICRRAGLPGFVLYSYDEQVRHNFISKIDN
jgi:uncharacterized lipoprotein YddW (UPF0748 family)